MFKRAKGFYYSEQEGAVDNKKRAGKMWTNVGKCITLLVWAKATRVF